MLSKRLIIILLALVGFSACYANRIEAKAEASAGDISSAGKAAMIEARAQLENIFAPIFQTIVSEYEDEVGDFTMPTHELIKKVQKQVYTTYITYEQKMAKTYKDGQNIYIATVTASIQSERLIMAMDRYLLPKAGENRKGHDKKVKQLREVITSQFDLYNLPLTGDSEPEGHSRKHSNKR